MIHQTTCQYSVMPFGDTAEVSVSTGDKYISLKYPEYDEDGTYKGMKEFARFDLAEAEELAKSLFICAAAMREEIGSE